MVLRSGQEVYRSGSLEAGSVLEQGRGRLICILSIYTLKPLAPADSRFLIPVAILTWRQEKKRLLPTQEWLPLACLEWKLAPGP